MVTNSILAYPCGTERKCKVARMVTRVVTLWSYGNVLNYRLAMLSDSFLPLDADSAS